MRTLHVGLRVSELERSLAFYTTVGYTVVGSVEGTPFGTLFMLRLPGDGFVTIELVHDPAEGAEQPVPLLVHGRRKQLAKLRLAEEQLAVEEPHRLVASVRDYLMEDDE